MSRLPRLLTILCLAFAVAAPAAQAAVGQPLTSGPNYDRNPTVVQDGKATYLFFTRSETPCNRLQGCAADDAKYDLWYEKSLDGGKTFGPATFAAANPAPADVTFRGRTIAAVNDGTRVLIFWANGGSQSALYKVEKPLGSDAFTPGAPVAGVDPSVFNTEAVSRGGGLTFLYTEQSGPQGYGIYARPFSGQTAGAPTLVAANRNLPKAIVDNRKPNVIRMTYTDGSTVYVNSSANGLTFGNEQPVATASGNDTYWDPNLAQTRNGFYYLTFAPDRGEGPAGRQQLAVTTSKDFSRWTEPRFITPAEQAGTKYWDYWPEGFTPDKGNDLNLYYTSERGFAGNPVGTGHIWALPGDDHDNGFDFGGGKGWDD